MIPLLSPKELQKKYPLHPEDKRFIHRSRSLAKKIFHQKEKKLLIIVGPCSIHCEKSFLEYAKKLQELSKKLEKHLFIILRFFHEKPRSSIGWKGLLYDPLLKNASDIPTGMLKTRSLMLQLAKLRLPVATEILEPLTISYFQDLITWGFIGSRTSTSQIHRQLASSLPFPIGMKNTHDGDLDTAINSILSAQSPHSYCNITKNGKISAFQSKGNPYAHLVLRGAKNQSNYDLDSLKKLQKKMQKKKIFFPIIIDSSHDNSKKNLENQKKCFQEVVLQSIKNPWIIGIMLESFLHKGSQKIAPLKNLYYGVSITDPCLSFQETKKLLLWAYHSLSTSINSVQN